MSKMSELSTAVAELKRCGEALISIADSLKGLCAENTEAETAKESKTTNAAPETKIVTLEAVRAVLAEKSRNGHTAEVRELLKKYGAEKLSEIDPSEYTALLSEAEVL